MNTNCFAAAILTSFGAVTSTGDAPIIYNFNGTIIMPPDSLVTTAGLAAQASAGRQCLTWAEWPT